MRKWFIILGKCIIVLLYWALICLVVWLFYDEYMTEHQWSSICYIISISSMGIIINGLLVRFWLFENEFDQFEELHPKSYRILETVIKIPGFILLGVSVVSFLLPSLGTILVMSLCGLMQIISVVWYAWAVIISLFIACYILKCFKKQSALRAFSKILYRIALICAIILIIFTGIYVWRELMECDETQGNSLLAGYVILLFLGGFLLYLLYASLSKGILSFARSRYALFLRAFKDDGNLSGIYDLLSKSISIPLMKIGNPSMSDSKNANEHWLPLSNWKYFLKYYCTRAKVIIFVAASTDGLLWEVLNNVKYLNKCIIYYSSNNELVRFRNKLQGVGDTRLRIIIHSIDELKSASFNGNAFIIIDNQLYIDDVQVLINAVLNNNYHGIKYITLNNVRRDEKKPISLREHLFRHFHILGVINFLETAQNYTIRGFLKGFANVVVFAVHAGAVLLSLGMIVGGLLYIWFALESESCNKLVTIYLSAGFIYMGIWLIREWFKR